MAASVLLPSWKAQRAAPVVGMAALVLMASLVSGVSAQPPAPAPAQPRRIAAPELEGGTDWLNTASPIRLADLRGKIVVLDFWTLCCINCIHVLPDLAKLEKKYPNEVVVIGVHSPKFENERDTQSIRKAILRYEISHPVINDANNAVWRAYDVGSWPTLVLIDPEGYYVGRGSGEGLYNALDTSIAKLIDEHRRKKTLNEKPMHFDLLRYSEAKSPLFFPGKVLADVPGNRLFIADSTHHRIVITDLTGKKIAVAGTGAPGKEDGPFNLATFNDPQGMALYKDELLVADRKNHLVRSLDLKNRHVKTIAGTGFQGQDRYAKGAALSIGLNSPWDLYRHENILYIAMAGHHQIWTLDLVKGVLAPLVGSGREDIIDSDRPMLGALAQPSGLASDGAMLWIADSEVSAIRQVPLSGMGRLGTVVGQGLFEYGDVDGQGAKVRLQHALGVAYHEGKLFVADTYNSKIKVIDPVKKTSETFLGGDGGWLAGPLFSEPGGISVGGDKLYVADTNAHRIRVVDLKTKTVATLPLSGVEPPARPVEAKAPAKQP